MKTYKIFPGIGIARLGNSEVPNGYFIGPEAPGIVPDAEGSYRDDQKKMKRQGARFRIYEYETDTFGGEKVVREITASTAKITWYSTVKVLDLPRSPRGQGECSSPPCPRGGGGVNYFRRRVLAEFKKSTTTYAPQTLHLASTLACSLLLSLTPSTSLRACPELGHERSEETDRL